MPLMVSTVLPIMTTIAFAKQQLWDAYYHEQVGDTQKSDVARVVALGVV